MTGGSRARREWLIWNWKGAVLSAILRGSLFLILNLSAGPANALVAMNTQAGLRFVTGGFSAGLIERLCRVNPPWLASSLAFVVLPLLIHGVELAVHARAGTPRVFLGVAVSILFTALSTAFQFFAMRRGTLIAGAGRRRFSEDLRALPRLLVEFLCSMARPILSPLRARSIVRP